MLVDYASEEDDMSWHHHHSYKVTRLRPLPTLGCGLFAQTKQTATHVHTTPLFP